jgi:hypothetical protein
MEKLDRLGWADGISFVSHGIRIGIRVNDSSVLEQVGVYLPPDAKASSFGLVDVLFSLHVGGDNPTANLRRYHVLYVGSSRIYRAMDLEKVLETLESTLHFIVAIGARRRIFVHAGVVGWKGRAIVLPGASMSGKTTLVAELIRAGAAYYSDEFAVVDSHGRIHPFPRPLRIRQDGEPRPTRYPVESLGGRSGTTPLPVGLVAVTSFKAGANWHPRVLTPGQGLLVLMQNTLLARVRPHDALKFLRPIALNATVLKGPRGEAREMAQGLLVDVESAIPDRSCSGLVDRLGHFTRSMSGRYDGRAISELQLAPST